MSNWQLPQVSKTVVNRLVKNFALTPITAQILVNRGLTKSKDVDAFLNPNLNQLHAPHDLTDAQKAATLISEHIKNKQKICVFGDFDVDGLTATALLVRVLKKVGAAVWPVIPSRFIHGYGLSASLIKKIAAHNFALIVAVDCGIANFEEVRLAKKLGLKIIIADHHEPPELLPEADAVVNPKRPDCRYPFKELAGVGVAYKLAQLVAANFNQPEIVDAELDLVALGTVCDLQPLTGENRVLTYYGLKQMEKKERVGLVKLCQAAGLSEQKLTSEHLGFILGPRINAAGRLSTAYDCLYLLLTADEKKALQLALKVNKQNQERSQIEEKMLADALALIDPQKKQKTIVVSSPEWHEGVKGIVASRLVDYFYRPTVVFTLKQGVALGSARSIPGFNLYEALKKCSDLLVNWGGHQAAAGLSVKVEQLELFKEKFEQVAQDQLSEVDLSPTIKVDAVADFQELNFELLAQLSKLAPFGIANPVPQLLIPNVFFDNQSLTANGRHVKLLVTGDSYPLPAIMFRASRPEEVVKEMRAVDLVAHLSLDEFNGQKQLWLKLVDFKAVASPVGLKKKKSAISSRFSNNGSSAPFFIDWRGQADVKDRIVEFLKHRQAFVYLRDEPSAVKFSQYLKEQGVFLDHNLIVTSERRPQHEFNFLILYHPPLNQQVFTDLMASGAPNSIFYLAYSESELAENIKVVKSLWPDRKLLAQVWQALSQLNKFDLQSAALLCRQVLSNKIYPMAVRKLTEQAIIVFKELNLITEKEGEYVLTKPLKKVDLSKSPCYCLIASTREANLKFLTLWGQKLSDLSYHLLNQRPQK